MKKLFYTLLVFLFTANVLAQRPKNYFQQKIGNGKANQTSNLIVTPDSGYIVAGYSYFPAKQDADIFVLKVGRNARKEWIKTYGTSSNDYASRIINISSGGYLIAGNTLDSSTGLGGILLLKLDRSGNLIWSKVIHGTTLQPSKTKDVVESNDGGFVVLGDASPGFYPMVFVVKVDGSGDVMWTRTIANDSIFPSAESSSICRAGNDGYAICASFNHSGITGYDIWMMKIGDKGDVLWSKFFGGFKGVNNYDFGKAVVSLKDNTILFAGESSTPDNDWDNVLVKVKQNGDLIWSKRYGTSGSYPSDKSVSIIQNKEGEIVLLSHFDSSNNRGSGPGFMKINLDGNFISGSKINLGSRYNIASSLVQDVTGHYLYAGSTEFDSGPYYGSNSDLHIARLTSELETCNSYPFMSYSSDFGTYASLKPFVGHSDCISYDLPFNVEVRNAALDYLCSSDDFAKQNIPTFASTQFELSVYPNPVIGKTLFLRLNKVEESEATVNIISGNNGKTFISQKITINGKIDKAIDISALPTGLYIIKVRAGNFEQSHKFLKQ